MNIDLIVCPLLLLGAIFCGKSESPQKRMRYVIFCSLVLLLKVSLRSVTVGVDTSHYAGYFYDSINTPWSDYIASFFIRYQTLSGMDDAGYPLLTKLFSTFISDFNVFTFVIEGSMFFLPIGVLIYKNCDETKKITFSYMLLNGLFLGLPMANARQLYALGLCVWAYMFVQNKKYLSAAIFIALGYFIHMSCLLFAIPIALSFLKEKYVKTIAVIGVVMAPISLLIPNAIIVFMGNFVGSEKYASYGMNGTTGGAVTYISLSLLMCLFCMIAYWKKMNNDNKLKQYMIMIALTTFFAPLIYSNGSMIRITMYFQLFFLIIFPNAIDIYFKNNRFSFYNIAIYALMILTIITAQEYRFFWEENQNPWLNWS